MDKKELAIRLREAEEELKQVEIAYSQIERKLKQVEVAYSQAIGRRDMLKELLEIENKKEAK